MVEVNIFGNPEKYESVCFSITVFLLAERALCCYFIGSLFIHVATKTFSFYRLRGRAICDMVNDMVRLLEFLGVSKLGPTIFQHKIHLFTADMKNSVYKKDASYHSYPHPTGKSRSYNLALEDMVLASTPSST